MASVSDTELEPWVLEVSNKLLTRNCRRRFAGYIKAYILSFLRVFKDEFGEWPTVQHIVQVFGYSQANKPRVQLRELEDEGYVQLDASRCRVVDILREPYFVPRPAFAKDKINEYCRRLRLSSAPKEVSAIVPEGGASG